VAFGIQPSELWAMEADEVVFWLAQAERIHGKAES
jgi:hypothetical protein